MYHLPLRNYLQIAYRLTGDRLSGPTWMDAQRYDVNARMLATEAKRIAGTPGV
jgi:uncharacterized protein (TIGR03435 family)